MCLIKRYRKWRKRRRDRIYEGPSVDIDGGTRISHDDNAPKEIISRELIRFSCRFSAVSLYENESGLKHGVYKFTASKGTDGVCAKFECTNPKVSADGEHKEIRSEELLYKLDAALRKYNVAQYNGQYYKVSGLPGFYGATVDAEYASGETLYCYNNQDPFLPTELVQELCEIFGIDRTEDEKN